MKSPHHLAQQLARQWQRSDWREAHLLAGAGAWPLHLSIGAPTAHSFQHASPALRQHLQAWQAITDHGPGSVQWAPRSYRGGAAPLPVPLHWTLECPSDAMAAIVRFAGREHASVAADHQALAAVLAQADVCFHRLLLRRPGLWPAPAPRPGHRCHPRGPAAGARVRRRQAAARAGRGRQRQQVL